MKRFYIQNGIGKAKYIVNHHDGTKTHKDGSAFFDISIFKNKKELAKFTNNLRKNGYTENAR